MQAAFRKIFNSPFWWLWLVIVLFAVNFLASRIHGRLDLTREKRYSLSQGTKELINAIDDEITMDVFLTGEFPSGFQKLANSAGEFLELLKDRNPSKISYRFISPLDQVPGTTVTWGDTLVRLGAVPINLTVQKEAGESSNIIFPMALLRYRDRQSLVSLYPGASDRISQDEINSAEALMEYQFANAIHKLVNPQRPGVAYSTGNGEPTDGRTYDLVQTLRSEYEFGMLDLKQFRRVPDEVALLLIVKPSLTFTEDEKLKIDQFVMNGGKLLCFIDNLFAEQDSLRFQTQTVAYDRNLNLTDLFFRYGLRVNADLLMDLQCDVIPFVVGGSAENPQFAFLHWNYFPLLSAAPGQAIGKNLGYVLGKFVNSIDTINVPGVRKTPLLVTSPNSRIISTPALISLNENKNVPKDEQFKRDAIPAAMLLEGSFTSLFRNRISRAAMDSLAAGGRPFKAASAGNKMIVVADGDMVLNDFIRGDDAEAQVTPLPMGFNKYTYTEYQNQTEFARLFVPVANRQFLMNCVEYLLSDPSISQTRNKEIVLRLLDAKKVKEEKTTWQLVNIVVPVFLVVAFGFIYQQARKRKYSDQSAQS